MTQAEKRLYLLTYLMEESMHYKKLDIPQNEREQKQLLRTLLNVRPAREVSE